MVVHCSTCGFEQPVDTTKFCGECGAKLGAAASASNTEARGPLIRPLEGSLNCSTHEGEKVVGFCAKCQDLVCVKCLSEKPQKHAECGTALSLDELMSKQKPFEDQKSRLSDELQNRQSLLQKLQSAKSDAETKRKDGVSRFHDLESDSLKVLEKKFEVEVKKLRADKNTQEQLIKQATKEKVAEVEQSLGQVVDQLKERIDDVTAQVQSIKNAQQQLSADFNLEALPDHVAANKSAGELLSRSPDTRVTDLATPAVTADDKTAFIRLAALTVEVKSKMPEARPAAVPVTGPTAKSYFKKGARVVRGPDWRYSDQDGGGPGCITGYRVGRPGWVVVAWDKGGSNNYRAGAEGKYDLQPIHPPS